jgi:hypothetical protein
MNKSKGVQSWAETVVDCLFLHCVSTHLVSCPNLNLNHPHGARFRAKGRRMLRFRPTDRAVCERRQQQNNFQFGSYDMGDGCFFISLCASVQFKEFSAATKELFALSPQNT